MFVRPFGFAGRQSHSRARSPCTSKEPPFVSPVNTTAAFSERRLTPVRSTPALPRRAVRSV